MLRIEYSCNARDHNYNIYQIVKYMQNNYIISCINKVFVEKKRIKISFSSKLYTYKSPASQKNSSPSTQSSLVTTGAPSITLSLHFENWPENSYSPKIPNTPNLKRPKMLTCNTCGSDCRRAYTTSYIPFKRDIIRRGRSARTSLKVLNIFSFSF